VVAQGRVDRNGGVKTVAEEGEGAVVALGAKGEAGGVEGGRGDAHAPLVLADGDKSGAKRDDLAAAGAGGVDQKGKIGTFVLGKCDHGLGAGDHGIGAIFPILKTGVCATGENGGAIPTVKVGGAAGCAHGVLFGAKGKEVDAGVGAKKLVKGGPGAGTETIVRAVDTAGPTGEAAAEKDAIWGVGARVWEGCEAVAKGLEMRGAGRGVGDRWGGGHVGSMDRAGALQGRLRWTWRPGEEAIRCPFRQT